VNGWAFPRQATTRRLLDAVKKPLTFLYVDIVVMMRLM